MLNNKKNNQIVFPENNASIIKEILEKNELQETHKEIFKKWQRGERAFGSILSELAVKACKENLSSAKLISLIQKELKINKAKAKKISEDLNKKLISLANKNNAPSEETSSSIGDLLLPEEEEEK